MFNYLQCVHVFVHKASFVSMFHILKLSSEMCVTDSAFCCASFLMLLWRDNYDFCHVFR